MTDKEKQFLDIAFEKGFWIACRELNIPRDEWGKYHQLVKNYSCPMCGERVEVAGLCEDCMTEQTAFAMELGEGF